MLTTTERRLTQAFVRHRPSSIQAALELGGGAFMARGRTGVCALSTPERGIRPLSDHLAVTLPGPFSATELRRTTRAVAEDWDRQGRDPVAAIGAALFQGDGHVTAAYLAEAQRSTSSSESVAPGWADAMRTLCAELVGERVDFRERFAPPGFVVIDTHTCAAIEGDVHFDWEGMALHASAALCGPSFTLVLSVKTAEAGGGLRVWDWHYAPDARAGGRQGPGSGPVAEIAYEPGQVTIIDGRTLHQVAASAAGRLRIVFVGHLGLFREGWRLWL